MTGGARTARAGRPALTASAPGSKTPRGWGAGDRVASTHRDVHSQRTPLLAGVFFAAAPSRAGNIFLLLGVHGRASHNFNQKLIPGDSFQQFGPLLPSPAPAFGLGPRALYYYPSTPKTPRGDFPGLGRWRRYLGPPPLGTDGGRRERGVHVSSSSLGAQRCKIKAQGCSGSGVSPGYAWQRSPAG